MANEDKFSKTIDDEQLDQVAGGTASEIKKDIAFLNAIGIKVDKNEYDINKLRAAWKQVEVNSYAFYDSKLKNGYSAGDTLEDYQQLTRQDAMIEAMRATGKFVDLDQYL